MYATHQPIPNYTHEQRADYSPGDCSQIYVTLFPCRPSQGHPDGCSGPAQRSNRSTSLSATTNCQQVAQTLLRGTLGGSRKPSSFRASAQFFPLNWSWKSKPLPASYPRTAASHCLVIAVRIWSAKSSGAAWWLKLAAGPFGAGSTRMPFAPGSIAVGFFLGIRTFSPRLSGCQRLLGFQNLYEQVAKPFEWKFTRTDLQDLMNRLIHKPQLAL